MEYFGIKINAKKQDDNTAVIDIDGEIGISIDFEEWKIKTENTNTGFKKKLKEIGDVKEIVVNINSLGGDVNEGISIHDLLKETKAKIITNIKGFTASAATIIAMAGDKINMSDNALFLIHKSWTWGAGNANEMKAVVGLLEAVDSNIVNIYQKRTGLDKEKIEALMNENNGNGIWLNAEKAKEYGYIDNIVEPSPKNLLNKVFLNSAMPPIPEELEKLINNQIDNKMKIKSLSFPFLANLFAKKEAEKTEQEFEITPENLAEVESNLKNASETIATLTTEKETAVDLVEAANVEKAALQNQLNVANEEIATLKEKLLAAPTSVDKKEDPSLEDAKNLKSKNELAAEENLKALKDE